MRRDRCIISSRGRDETFISRRDERSKRLNFVHVRSFNDSCLHSNGRSNLFAQKKMSTVYISPFAQSTFIRAYAAALRRIFMDSALLRNVVADPIKSGYYLGCAQSAYDKVERVAVLAEWEIAFRVRTGAGLNKEDLLSIFSRGDPFELIKTVWKSELEEELGLIAPFCRCTVCAKKRTDPTPDAAMNGESDDDDDDITYASAARRFFNSEFNREIINGCFTLPQPPPFPFTAADFPPLSALPDYLMHYAPFGADIDQVDGKEQRVGSG